MEGPGQALGYLRRSAPHLRTTSRKTYPDAAEKNTSSHCTVLISKIRICKVRAKLPKGCVIHALKLSDGDGSHESLICGTHRSNCW